MNKAIATSIHYLGGLPADAVTAGKEDLNLGAYLFHPVINIAATHIRHDHVQEHDVNLLLVIFKDLNRFFSASGRQDLIAQMLQHLLGDIQYHFFIIHKKNRFLSPYYFILSFTLRPLRLALFPCRRQIDIEGGPMTHFAINIDESTMILMIP